MTADRARKNRLSNYQKKQNFRSLKMTGITRTLFVLIWCVMVMPSIAFKCDVCDCLLRQKTVRCANLGLRFLPEFNRVDPEFYDYVDLRQNLLTFIDFRGLSKFRLINLLENPISCDHGLINTDSLTEWNEVLINCKLPQFTPTQEVRTSQETKKVTQITISTPKSDGKDSDTVIGIGGVFGEASGYTKGKLEVAWGVSTTLTIFGIIGGAVSCVTMCKILQKLKLIDRRLIYSADFEAPAPERNGIELFEDLSNTVRNVFTIPRNSRVVPKHRERNVSTQDENSSVYDEEGHDEVNQDYIQVPNQRNMYFECYGGEPSDDDDEEQPGPILIKPARLRASVFMNAEALAADLGNISFQDNDDYRESIPYDTDSEEDN